MSEIRQENSSPQDQVSLTTSNLRVILQHMLQRGCCVRIASIGDRACLSPKAAKLPQLSLPESVRLTDDDYPSLVLTCYKML